MMNLQHLTERLRQHKETSLRVVLTPRLSSDALAELIAAIQANESVTRVELLTCGSFLQNASPSLWQSLLGAILGLPNLQSFQMRGCSTASSFNDANCAIPMQAFASIHSSSLKLFSLAQLVLCGGPRDLQCFTASLQQQTSLQDFQLISIGLLNEESQAETTSVLEPLLKTLAVLPRLKNLEISSTFTPLGVLEEVPHSLFQSKSLQRLSISDFIFPEAAFGSVWDDLAKNFWLKELAISGNLTRQVAPKLKQVWKHNKTMDAIALRVESFDDEVCTQELASAIGASHLTVVSLCNFFGGPLSAKGRNAFSIMLETNCTLEYLYVPCPFSDIVFWNNVRLYCGLNSCGRKRAEKKGQDTKEPWSSEISRSFYLAANKNAHGGQPLTPKGTSSSKPTITLASTVLSPGKRHQKLVHEARSSKRRKFPGTVPTQGLSSMFIR